MAIPRQCHDKTPPNPYVRKARRMMDGLWASAKNADEVANPGGGFPIVAGRQRG